MNFVVYYSKMNRFPMNWDDLRVFLALVESGSLSAAARDLGLSQPTVGRRIQALEHALDERLFDRLPRGYVPTAAARALLPMAQAMSAAAEAVDRRRAVSDTLEGSVRISAGAAMSRFLCNRVALLLDGMDTADLAEQPSRRTTGLPQVSPREAEVARLLCGGLSNRDVAKSLSMAPDTVKWHLKNIFGKLGVSNRTQAVLRLQEIGLTG